MGQIAGPARFSARDDPNQLFALDLVCKLQLNQSIIGLIDQVTGDFGTEARLKIESVVIGSPALSWYATALQFARPRLAARLARVAKGLAWPNKSWPLQATKGHDRLGRPA